MNPDDVCLHGQTVIDEMTRRDFGPNGIRFAYPDLDNRSLGCGPCRRVPMLWAERFPRRTPWSSPNEKPKISKSHRQLASLSITQYIAPA